MYFNLLRKSYEGKCSQKLLDQANICWRLIEQIIIIDCKKIAYQQKGSVASTHAPEPGKTIKKYQ